LQFVLLRYFGIGDFYHPVGFDAAALTSMFSLIITFFLSSFPWAYLSLR